MKVDGLNILPPVHRIEGFLFDHPGGGNPQLGSVLLQYTDQKKSWHQLNVPAMDALYLLNLLEAWSKEQGLDHLRRSAGG